MSQSTRPSRQRRGAALIIAVSMIALVAVAMVMIAKLVSVDAGRTREEATAAQLRLMLLAGQDVATEQVDALSPDSPAVTLPSTLADGTLTIEIDPSGSETRKRVIIRAVLLDRRAAESVTFERSAGGWTLVDVEFHGVDRQP